MVCFGPKIRFLGSNAGTGCDRSVSVGNGRRRIGCVYSLVRVRHGPASSTDSPGCDFRLGASGTQSQKYLPGVRSSSKFSYGGCPRCGILDLIIFDCAGVCQLSVTSYYSIVDILTEIEREQVSLNCLLVLSLYGASLGTRAKNGGAD